MELLITGAIVAGSFIFGIMGNLVASELYDCAARLARWLTKQAVARAPRESQSRYEEEWLAHLEECSGNFSKLAASIGFMMCSKRVILAGTSRHKLIPRQFETEFVKLIDELSKLSNVEHPAVIAVNTDLVSTRLKLEPRHISVLNGLATAYRCSVGVSAGALLALMLEHPEHFRVEERLKRLATPASRRQDPRSPSRPT